MDAPQFDDVTRSLTSPPSRRAALRTLLGAAIGSVAAATSLSAEGKKGKHKKKGKKRKKKSKQGANTPDLCAGLADPAFCNQFIGGTALSLIPPGTPGILSVVALGSYKNGRLPFILRNNTGKDVYDVSATATVRNASGQLIGSGEDLAIDPNVLRAGSVAMGYIYFSGATFGEGSTYAIEPQASPLEDFQYENERDLIFGEANYIEGRVVGSMTNGYRETLDGPIGLQIACFNAAGALLSYDNDYSGPDTLGSGQQAFFQFSSYTGPLDCPYYLVTGSGFSLT